MAAVVLEKCLFVVSCRRPRLGRLDQLDLPPPFLSARWTMFLPYNFRYVGRATNFAWVGLSYNLQPRRLPDVRVGRIYWQRV